jgi:heme A synthase
MQSFLIAAHSGMRYLVMLMLIAVIINSLIGFTGKKPFGKKDNLLSLFLLIFTHIQFLLGIGAYFVSGLVQFNDQTMQTDELRYWTVEHAFGMLIAVVLITVARSTSKRMADPTAKHKRLFLFNTIALVVILVVLLYKGVPVFGSRY